MSTEPSLFIFISEIKLEELKALRKFQVRNPTASVTKVGLVE